MVKLIWTPSSLQDIDNACEYIAKDSPRYAYLFAERIVRFIETIPAQPFLGAVVPEYRQADLRERLFQNYRVDLDSVNIITIIHAARLFPPIPPQ